MPIMGDRQARSALERSRAAAVAYIFAEDRKAQHARELFKGFSGILQVDGCAGYNHLIDPNRDGGAVTIASCFAHARRKFYDVHVATRSPIAAEALRRIGTFHDIEVSLRRRPSCVRRLLCKHLRRA
jgi:hypothetical protein